MSDAEKMAEHLERVGRYDVPIDPRKACREAAALIRRLQAENEALRVKQAGGQA
jgi:hypothetical protein